MKVYERMGENSRPQRPRSFWSAPRIATSAIVGLPATLRILRVKTDKFHWFWSPMHCVYKAFKTRMSLDLGCFPLCQRFQKLRSEFKWNGFGFVSVSSDRNIRDHLWRWSTYFSWNIPTEICRSIFDIPVLCPNKGIRKKNLK